MQKITQNNKLRAGWTENNKDKKNKGIANADKIKTGPDKFFVRTISLFGQKGIYHQVEFRLPWLMCA